MRDTTRQALITGVTSLIVSMAGGGVSTYVAYRVMEYRVSELERNQQTDHTLIEKNRENAEISAQQLNAKLSDVAGDVKYIRGLLERKP